MSQDIRSFFSVKSKKSGSTGIVKPKPKPVIVSDSDEDIVEDTPQKEKAQKNKKKIVSSDSEDEDRKANKTSNLTKPNLSKLKAVNIDDVFLNAQVKQSKIIPVAPKKEEVVVESSKTKKTPKKSKKKSKEAEAHEDDDLFLATLDDIDENELNKTINEALKNVEGKYKKKDEEKQASSKENSPKNKEKKEKSSKEGSCIGGEEKQASSKENFPKNKEKKEKSSKEGSCIGDEEKQASLKENSPKNKEKKEKSSKEGSCIGDTGSKKKEKEIYEKKKESPSKEKKKSHDPKIKEESLNDSKTDTPKEKRKAKNLNDTLDTPSKKRKLDHTDSGIDPDQERHEKKRLSAIMYQQYKNRGGPKNHGMKEYPKGKPDCLKNLTFLRTGVLDSMDGDDFECVITQHGGRVVHGVSRKVNFIVEGEDPGPSKLEKARSYNIPSISEDELLDMILEKSSMPKKYVKRTLSEDLGIGSSTSSSQNSISPKAKKAKYSEDASGDAPQHKKTKIAEDDVQPSSSSSFYGKKIKNEIESPQKTKKTKIEDEFKTSSSTSSFYGKKIKEEIGTQIVYEKSKLIKTGNLPQIERPKTEIALDSMAWTDKYKPQSIQDVIGQQSADSNLSKLKKWLNDWYKNKEKKDKSKTPLCTNDGAFYKCALLSGSPGVGKTTTATLVSKSLGFDIVEFNASDTRSKRLLNEEVSQLLKTTTIAGFAKGDKQTNKKRVLLMDEVDGMAGNEDRGGVNEMLNLIKNTSIPIICMCNDRFHQKLKTLGSYCFDLRFGKPKLEQIRGKMMSICFKENIKIEPKILNKIIEGANCDVRQSLNNLYMFTSSNKSLSLDQADTDSKKAKKDIVLGPWEVIKLVFNREDNKDMSIAERSKLFFYDYSIGPLFVQENYLRVQLNCTKTDKLQITAEKLDRISAAADAISLGDIFESKIRSTNNWSLLESQAMHYSVIPSYCMSGCLTRTQFPSWLGKNSKRNKFKRMLCDLQIHTRTCTSGSRMALKLDYLRPLRNAIVGPLIREGSDGIPKAVQVMKNYNLLREDLDNIVELSVWSGDQNPLNVIDSKIKSAFTRMYNKEIQVLPFAPPSAAAKKRAKVAENEDGADENESDNGEEPDDVKGDAMIKVKTKKPTAAKKGESAGSSKAKAPSKPRAKKTK